MIFSFDSINPPFLYDFKCLRFKENDFKCVLNAQKKLFHRYPLAVPIFSKVCNHALFSVEHATFVETKSVADPSSRIECASHTLIEIDKGDG